MSAKELEPCLICGETYPPNGLIVCPECANGAELFEKESAK